jgi:hypothetical protein
MVGDLKLCMKFFVVSLFFIYITGLWYYVAMDSVF